MTQDDLSVESTLRLLAHIMREGHTQIAVKVMPDFLDEAAQTIEDLKTELAIEKSRHAPQISVHVPKTDTLSDTSVEEYIEGYWEAG